MLASCVMFAAGLPLPLYQQCALHAAVEAFSSVFLTAMQARHGYAIPVMKVTCTRLMLASTVSLVTEVLRWVGQQRQQQALQQQQQQQQQQQSPSHLGTASQHTRHPLAYMTI